VIAAYFTAFPWQNTLRLFLVFHIPCVMCVLHAAAAPVPDLSHQRAALGRFCPHGLPATSFSRYRETEVGNTLKIFLKAGSPKRRSGWAEFGQNLRPEFALEARETDCRLEPPGMKIWLAHSGIRVGLSSRPTMLPDDGCGRR